MHRPLHLERIREAFRVHPVVALLGPRQCGKTTLARMYRSSLGSGARTTYFDLEDPEALAALRNPKAVLGEARGLVVIDEIQRAPDLFPVLRVLADRPRRPARFLILGSASRDLIRQGSESLAGRIGFLELPPFSLAETGDWKRLWIRGGFPPAYLASTAERSWEWRKAYVSTFLERDIPNLGLSIPPQTLRRFWMMLTHYHGSPLNASEIGHSLGMAHTTVRHYVDLLQGTFMIRALAPWIANLGKRQVRTPKIYFRDSGLFHFLAGIRTHAELLRHPKLGVSWEATALEEVIRHHQPPPEECFFWGVHSQAELDLLLLLDGKPHGFEFKFGDAPRVTRSMKTALDLLDLQDLKVIYPGTRRFRMDDRIEAVGLETYLGE